MANTKVKAEQLEAAQTNITSLGTLTTLTVDDITINGSTISDAGEFTLDIGGDINIDADGGDINLKDGGTLFGQISNSSGLYLVSSISDADIFIRGNDGGSMINALTLDMSEAGAATFNSGVTTGGKLTVNDGGNATVAAIRFNAGLGISSPSTDQLNFITADTTKMIIGATGLVGIGAAANHSTLEVTGDKTTANNLQLTLRGATNTNKQLIMGFDTTADKSYITSQIAGSAQKALVINAANVGIGVTTGIDGKLHVAGNAVVGNSSTTAFSSFTAGGLDVAVGSGTKAFQVWDDNVTGTPRFIVERGGNVGIGTGSPGAALHVYAATGDVGITIETAEDSGAREPFLNLKSYATNANPVINFGDHAGYMGSIQYENQDDSMMFATNGSNHLYISSAGAVGIGGASAGDHLHVRDGSSSCNVRISGEGNINRKVQIGYDASVGAYVQAGSSGITTLRFYVDNTSYVSKFDSNGDFYSNDGTVHNLSDVRVKKDIAHLTDGLEIVKQLKPRTYKYTEDSEMYNEKSKDEVRYGFIANEVEEVASQYTKTGKGKVGNEEVEDFKSLSATKMIPMLVKAIQEQQALIETLQTKVAALESK